LGVFRIDLSTVGSGLIVGGLVHLLFPNQLLTTARYAYRHVLAVEFDPNPTAERRLRAVGLVLLAVGTVATATDRSVSISAE
jgi:uncharacterized protein YjeT (DUF2065 family)